MKTLALLLCPHYKKSVITALFTQRQYEGIQCQIALCFLTSVNRRRAHLYHICDLA